MTDDDLMTDDLTTSKKAIKFWRTKQQTTLFSFLISTYDDTVIVRITYNIAKNSKRKPSCRLLFIDIWYVLSVLLAD